MLANETGNAKFLQGLMIEMFILAIYAISYDLVLGITGLLSFGHAMFFAVGAYFTGIAFKNLDWGVVPTFARHRGVGCPTSVVVRPGPGPREGHYVCPCHAGVCLRVLHHHPGQRIVGLDRR